MTDKTSKYDDNESLSIRYADQNSQPQSDIGELNSNLNDHDKIVTKHDNFSDHEEVLATLNNLTRYIAENVEDINRLDRAAKLAEPLAESQNPRYIDSLAWLAYKRGHFNYSERLLKRAVELAPEDPEINFHLGMVFFYQQDGLSNARDCFRKALSQNKKFLGRDDAEKILAILEKTKR